MNHEAQLRADATNKAMEASKVVARKPHSLTDGFGGSGLALAALGGSADFLHSIHLLAVNWL